MADDLENSIQTNASGPKKASGDAGSVEQHSLSDQIAADRYLNSRQATKSGLGIRKTKLVPPGAS